ncbi:MAG TPA: hypothetical protein VE618_08640 [Myxococcaceae bacterium]|nr:hypothetical protein [Myxococcaceae bacterium]
MFRTSLLSALMLLTAGCAASRQHTLAEAEAQACAGLSDDELKNGPFARPAEIASVRPLLVEAFPRDDNPPTYELGGAVVKVRASPGLTAEWLQRLVDCDLARSAAMAVSAAEPPTSPFAFRGASAYVHSTGDGFAIEISSNEPRVAREILASAERVYQQPHLAAPSGAEQDASSGGGL